MITITTLFRHHNHITGSNQNRDRMGMRFTATSLCETKGGYGTRRLCYKGGREGGFEAERGGQQPSGQHPLVSTLPSGCRVHELGVADIGTGTSAFDVRSGRREQ